MQEDGKANYQGTALSGIDKALDFQHLVYNQIHKARTADPTHVVLKPVTDVLPKHITSL